VNQMKEKQRKTQHSKIMYFCNEWTQERKISCKLLPKNQWTRKFLFLVICSHKKKMLTLNSQFDMKWMAQLMNQNSQFWSSSKP